jgi:hypothetical protein
VIVLLHCLCNSQEAPLAIISNEVLGGNLDNCLRIFEYRYNKRPWDRLLLTIVWRLNYMLVDRTYNAKKCIYCSEKAKTH